MKAPVMHLRRSFATTAAAVLLTAPLLSSCGFDLNTDRVADNTVGTDDRSGDADGGVDILAAVVVAAQPDAGTFIATLANTSESDDATFESVQGAEGNTVVPGDFDAISIEARGYVNLADDGGVKLTGSFEAGDVLPLSIGFGDGRTVQLNVPVVRACEPYAGLDPEASESPTAEPSASTETPDASGSPSPLASGAASGSASPSASPSAPPSASASASASDSAEPSESASPYSCDFPRVGSTEDSGEGE